MEIHVCFSWITNDQIRSQFCTCHGSSAVVTCATLWPDLIIRIKAKGIFTGFKIQAHKAIIGLVEDCSISIALTHWRYYSLALSHQYVKQVPEWKSGHLHCLRSHGVSANERRCHMLKPILFSIIWNTSVHRIQDVIDGFNVPTLFWVTGGHIWTEYKVPHIWGCKCHLLTHCGLVMLHDTRHLGRCWFR